MILVTAALASAVVVGVVRDTASSPALEGRPLARCVRAGCPEADDVSIPVGYDVPLALTPAGSGSRVAALTPVPGTDPGPCRAEATVSGGSVRPALPPGRWRLILDVDGDRWGAVLASAGDQRAPTPVVSWLASGDRAVLSLTSDGGRPTDVADAVWHVRSPDGGGITVEVGGGGARWSPTTLQVSAAVAGPICRGRPATLAIAGLPRPAHLDAEVRLPDRTLTATVAVP